MQVPMDYADSEKTLLENNTLPTENTMPQGNMSSSVSPETQCLEIPETQPLVSLWGSAVLQIFHSQVADNEGIKAKVFEKPRAHATGLCHMPPPCPIIEDPMELDRIVPS